MAAPTVIMRPIVHWNGFLNSGLDVASLDSNMAYVLGGKSKAGTVKGEGNMGTPSAVSYDSLSTDITNFVNRNGDWFRNDDLAKIIATGTGISRIQVGMSIPGENTVYCALLLSMNYGSSPTYAALQAATSGAVPSASSVTVVALHNYQLSSGDYVTIHVLKITKTQDYIHVVLENDATQPDMNLLNVHFFTEADAYVFDQANDKIAFSNAGKDGEDWATFISDIPYTPYSGSDLLVPYYYDDNADLVNEMALSRPDNYDSYSQYGYTMVFQFEGQHYGPAGVNLWDDETMSERQSKMFTENVAGIWRPGQSDASLVNSHTRAKSGTDTDGYNASLAIDTAENVAYLVGILNEMWSINTDINPSQSGQESPVINLDYSYV